MSFHAANPADFPACPRAWRTSRTRAFRRATMVANLGLVPTDIPARITLQLRRTSAANVRMKNFVLERVCRYVSRLCSVTASGPFRRPAALGLLLRILRPFGVSVLPKTSLRTTAKSAVQTSFGPLRESRPSALGSRAHSLSSAQCDPSNNGRIQETETLSCTRTK
jgi:hypothetical protein